MLIIISGLEVSCKVSTRSSRRLVEAAGSRSSYREVGGVGNLTRAILAEWSEGRQWACVREKTETRTANSSPALLYRCKVTVPALTNVFVNYIEVGDFDAQCSPPVRARRGHPLRAYVWVAGKHSSHASSGQSAGRPSEATSCWGESPALADFSRQRLWRCDVNPRQ